MRGDRLQIGAGVGRYMIRRERVFGNKGRRGVNVKGGIIVLQRTMGVSF